MWIPLACGRLALLQELLSAAAGPAPTHTPAEEAAVASLEADAAALAATLKVQ